MSNLEESYKDMIVGKETKVLKETYMDLEDMYKKLEELKERYSVLEGSDNTDEYDDMLDDSYGEVNIAGYTYNTSYALKQLDPIAYNVGIRDYNDEEMSNIENEISDLEAEIAELENEDSEENEED